MNYAGPGVYEHHKGRRYFVLGLAKHSETDEVMVLYRPLYTTEWAHMTVRPLSSFDERVPAALVADATVPRFKRAQP